KNVGIYYLLLNMSENILKIKSYEFSIKIVKLYQHLSQSKQEFILSKQLIRSGTSIGALVREADFGQSRADFINKMSIALKEANETLYRLDILLHTEYITADEYELLYNLGEEILRILVATIKTAKKKNGY
ncbi:MAG TPA: four helix bundle protein, partial [Candidatus Absconditabacterales bacterium]|nr:four helix bundle protein [Candidatus Absconditabacterales bacterium]